MNSFDTDRSTRRFQIAGYVSIFAMVGMLGGWSATTTLNSAVIAPATIIAESNTKKIQHRDGGIIAKILVKDGDRVQPGQDLIVLDDTETKAELGIVDGALVEFKSKRARLMAQRDGEKAITFPSDLLARQADPDVASVLQGQVKLFTSRNAALDGKRSQLAEQVRQVNEQINGMDQQIAAHDQQLDFTKKELTAVMALREQGLVSLPRLLALQRQEAALEGERGQLVAGKAQAAGKIAEIKLQIIQIGEDDQAQTANDLRDAEAKVSEFEERKVAAEAKLKRIVVKSPILGEVYQLAVHTVGGVIQPAETLMLIVPRTDELVLQAQVTPQNIDEVHLDQDARIRFPAFHSRFTPEIVAKVIQVSADVSRVDQNTPPFYSVRLRIPPAELAKLSDENDMLRPGMPAEAFIQTAAQTPMSYLLKPLFDQLAHTWREQ
jgi:HlyD family secretion protein